MAQQPYGAEQAYDDQPYSMGNIIRKRKQVLKQTDYGPVNLIHPSLSSVFFI